MFVAIIAQEEEFDEKGAQMTPPGMHCINLPYLDDIRANPVEETATGLNSPKTSLSQSPESILILAREGLIDKMSLIVRAVTLNSFNPSKYPNPGLQWHYRILQAIALEEELPEKPEDKTIPKYSSIHKRIGPLAKEWGELLESEAPVPNKPVAAPAKRKAVTDGDSAPKVKREKKGVEAPSGDKLESLYEQGGLMTVCFLFGSGGLMAS